MAKCNQLTLLPLKGLNVWHSMMPAHSRRFGLTTSTLWLRLENLCQVASRLQCLYRKLAEVIGSNSDFIEMQYVVYRLKQCSHRLTPSFQDAFTCVDSIKPRTHHSMQRTSVKFLPITSADFYRQSRQFTDVRLIDLPIRRSLSSVTCRLSSCVKLATAKVIVSLLQPSRAS